MTNELATTEKNLPAQVKTPPGMGQIDGASSDDLQLSVLHLFQDIGNESDQYGDHPKGTWVDSMTQEALEEDSLFVPITAKKEWVVWYTRDSKAGKGMVEKYDSANEVPQQFKEDRDNYVVSETVTYFVLRPGELIPSVIRFKSTSLRAAKTLHTLEAKRHRSGKNVGMYKLGAVLKSNDKGKWFNPAITPAGDPQADMMQNAIEAYQLIHGGNFTVVDPGGDEEETSDIPF